MIEMHKKIGELNGRWALLLKISLSAMPMLVALQVYFVKQINDIHVQLARFEEWKNVSPRFTTSEAQLLKADILSTMGVQLTSIQRDLIKLQTLFEEHEKATITRQYQPQP